MSTSLFEYHDSHPFKRELLNLICDFGLYLPFNSLQIIPFIMEQILSEPQLSDRVLPIGSLVEACH